MGVDIESVYADAVPVYIDAAGVSRKAIIKSVAKGMVVGKVRGGGQIMVGGGDGGVFKPPPGTDPDWEKKETEKSEQSSASSAPPAYGSGFGEKLDGHYAPGKR